MERKRKKEEIKVPVSTLGKISLVLGLISVILSTILIVGYNIYPEKTEIIYSLIVLNPFLNILFFGLIHCGLMLSPLSLLCLMDRE